MHPTDGSLRAGTRAAPPRTKLIGRDHELATLLALIRAAPGRLVTVTGPGGAGKTRLARELADRIDPLWADGCAWVALANVPDAPRVAGAIARAAGVGDLSARPADETLVEALAHQSVLIVLDNFEHVLDAAPLVTEILDRAPEVRIVVTSRTALHLSGEQILGLGPLELPPEHDAAPSAARVRAYAAAEFLATRIAAVRPGFELTDTNARAIAELSRRLDGLPLALELAAARCNVLEPQALLARMATAPDAALSLLNSGDRDAPDRHRTLRDTVAWSVALLDDDARAALRRVSVLRGEWTLPDAESVCHPLTEMHVLDALSTLVDLHLVEPVPTRDRFTMLETIRAFAHEALVDAGEFDAASERHAVRFLALGAEAGNGLESGAELGWLARLPDELPNIRVAHTYLVEHGRNVDALTLGVALAPFWLHAGHLGDGTRWIDNDLAAVDRSALTPAALADALTWQAMLEIDSRAITTKRSGELIAQFDRALELCAGEPDRTHRWRVLEHLTHTLTLHGDLERAQALTEVALAETGAADNGYWRTFFLHRATLLAQHTGARTEAIALAHETVRTAESAGGERQAARSRQILGQLEADFTDLPTAVAALENNLRECEHVRDRRGVATTLVTLGALALIGGDVSRAAAWYGHGLRLSIASGYWHGQAFALAGTACVSSLAGHHREACILFDALAESKPILERGWAPEYTPIYDAFSVESHRVMRSDPSWTEPNLSWTDALDAGLAVTDELRGDLDGAALTAAVVANAPKSTAPVRRRAAAGPEPPDNVLSAREVEVLELIAGGLTNREIAAALFVSPKTVMHHSGSIYRKLNVRGRSEASAYAYRAGIVSP